MVLKGLEHTPGRGLVEGCAGGAGFVRDARGDLHELIAEIP